MCELADWGRMWLGGRKAALSRASALFGEPSSAGGRQVRLEVMAPAVVRGSGIPLLRKPVLTSPRGIQSPGSQPLIPHPFAWGSLLVTLPIWAKTWGCGSSCTGLHPPPHTHTTTGVQEYLLHLMSFSVRLSLLGLSGQRAKMTDEAEPENGAGTCAE